MTEVSARLSAAVAGRYRIERELGAGGIERLPKNGEAWGLLHDPIFWPLRDDPRFRRIREATDPEP